MDEKQREREYMNEPMEIEGVFETKECGCIYQIVGAHRKGRVKTCPACHAKNMKIELELRRKGLLS